ncbi:hypothetical protein PV726_06145 [Streptomyces europaeiscabiei]|uniref:hypothetical protein n=1 Tax=Streptomyces europaeiscabiei TaxID=146819 RepID=UPI0029B240A7|nr:hypothetical protein [Streptomyces europaeiscabiei]MDX3689923.1 hypothetical protein [Streptomyces europaeiscabiei]
MTASCGLCEEPIQAGYLCTKDAVALARRLQEMPALFEELTECLVPRRSGPAEFVSAASAGPRSPLDEDVLDLVDGGHVAEVLELWRADVQRVRWPSHGAPPVEPGMARRVAVAARWLEMELDWIAVEYPAAGDLAREVRGLETGMRSVVGDPVPRPQRLGLCVAVDDEGVVCGAVIKRLPGQTRVQCRWCGYAYSTLLDWHQLQQFQPKEEPCPSAS